MSIPAALTTMAICQIIITAGLVITVGVLVYAIFAIKNMVSEKVDEAMGKIQPLVEQGKAMSERALVIADQAKDAAEMVNSKLGPMMNQAQSTVETMTNKVGSIMDKVETTADRVTGRVQEVTDTVGTTVTSRVEQTSQKQVSTIANIAGVVMRLYQVYSEYRRAQAPAAPTPAAAPAPRAARPARPERKVVVETTAEAGAPASSI